MTAPSPYAWAAGQGAVSADNLNTFVQTVTTFAQLRTFTGLSNMAIYAQGGNTVGDGLQGLFYYNASVVAIDNNSTIIVPTGAVQGAWLNSSAALVLSSPYAYTTPTSGSTVTASSTANNLILNPAGSLATLTIAMPSTPADGQIFSVSTTQIITVLTFTATPTIYNAPTTLAAGAVARFQYSAAVNSWFRA